MNNVSLYTQIDSLPEKLKDEVRDFVEFLIKKSGKDNKKKKTREFGVLKGKIHMSPDFDEPLEDFKEYM